MMFQGSDLDSKERQMMLQGTAAASRGDFLSEDSHNVYLGGDFSIRAPPRSNNTTQQHPDPLDETDMQMLSDMDDEDLKAAIAASLMDSSPAAAMTEASNPKSENKDSREKTGKAENSL